MPVRLDVDREAVRVLVVAVGVREAARVMKLPQPTVQAWSARGKWLANCRPQPATQPRPLSMQPRATSALPPAEMLVNSLEQDGKQTRASLAIAARKAALAFQDMDGARVIDQSKHLKEIATSAATLHGWHTKNESGVHLNIALIMGSAE